MNVDHISTEMTKFVDLYNPQLLFFCMKQAKPEDQDLTIFDQAKGTLKEDLSAEQKMKVVKSLLNNPHMYTHLATFLRGKRKVAYENSESLIGYINVYAMKLKRGFEGIENGQISTEEWDYKNFVETKKTQEALQKAASET